VRCGVSLVIELPLPWCLSSAEGFARGGVGLQQATGVVDTICFGSELASPESLRRCGGGPGGGGFAPQLRHELDKGLSFAAARERAVTALYGRRPPRRCARPTPCWAWSTCAPPPRLGTARIFCP
jgi:predicted nucleotidyltransferase